MLSSLSCQGPGASGLNHKPLASASTPSTAPCAQAVGEESPLQNTPPTTPANLEDRPWQPHPAARIPAHIHDGCVWRLLLLIVLHLLALLDQPLGQPGVFPQHQLPGEVHTRPVSRAQASRGESPSPAPWPQPTCGPSKPASGCRSRGCRCRRSPRCTGRRAGPST